MNVSLRISSFLSSALFDIWSCLWRSIKLTSNFGRKNIIIRLFRAWVRAELRVEFIIRINIMRRKRIKMRKIDNFVAMRMNYWIDINCMKSFKCVKGFSINLRIFFMRYYNHENIRIWIVSELSFSIIIDIFFKIHKIILKNFSALNFIWYSRNVFVESISSVTLVDQLLNSIRNIFDENTLRICFLYESFIESIHELMTNCLQHRQNRLFSDDKNTRIEDFDNIGHKMIIALIREIQLRSIIRRCMIE